MSDTGEYLLRWRGRQSGPHSLARINRMLDEHEIGMGHEILHEEKWISLEEFFSSLKRASAPVKRESKPVVAPPATAPLPAPPPGSAGKAPPVRIKVSLNSPAATGANGLRPRHRLVFALLAVFGGFLGVHNFYARQWLSGLLQLLLSVATVLMGFGIVASWGWAMVEAVVVRKDGAGVEMI